MNKNKKVISVLGCGWLGFPLAKVLLNDGWQVKGATTTKAKLIEIEKAGIEAFLLEIKKNNQSEFSFSVSEEVLQSFFSSSVLVLNIPPKGRSNPDVEIDYFNKIKHILQLAEKYGTSKVVFVGSTGVYGNANRLVVESDELHPISSSGKALVKVENYLKRTNSLKYSVLRLAGLMGGQRVPGRFFAGKTNIKGGDIPVNMVYREDCIAAIQAVLNKDMFGEIFNICADEHPPKREFYTQKAKEEGFETPEFAAISEPSPFKIVNNEKSKRLLGLKYRRIWN